jgi:hypothetical protein
MIMRLTSALTTREASTVARAAHGHSGATLCDQLRPAEMAWLLRSFAALQGGADNRHHPETCTARMYFSHSAGQPTGIRGDEMRISGN